MYTIFCWYVYTFLYPQGLINGAAQKHSDLHLKMLLCSATSGQELLRVFLGQGIRPRGSKF